MAGKDTDVIVPKPERAEIANDVKSVRLKIFIEALQEAVGTNEVASSIENLSPVLQLICRQTDERPWLPAPEEIKLINTLCEEHGSWHLVYHAGQEVFISLSNVFFMSLPHRITVREIFYRIPSLTAFFLTHAYAFVEEKNQVFYVSIKYRDHVPYNEIDTLFLSGLLSGFLKYFKLDNVDLRLSNSPLPRRNMAGAEGLEQIVSDTRFNSGQLRFGFHLAEGKKASQLFDAATASGESQNVFVDEVLKRTQDLLRDKRDLLTAVDYLNMANNELEKEIRLNKKELKMARNIQKGFVPQRIPDWKGLQFWVKFYPLTEVSGDFYDYLSMGSNKLAVLVGDVSGHGVPAALISAIAKLSFNNHRLDSPAEVLSKVNLDILNHVKREGYLTAFYLILHDNYNIMYSVAAAPSPLLYRARTGEVEKLPGSGTMLGMFPDANELFFDQSTHLEPGDKVFIFTDGLVESKNAAGTEVFDEPRVIEAIKRTKGLDVQQSSEKVMQEYEAFTLGTERTDDLTMITIMLSERQDEFNECLKQARTFYNARNYSKACERLKHATSIFPRHTSTLYMLGKYLALSGSYKEAIDYLYQYNILNPYNADSFTILAYCAYKLGNYQKAHDELKRSLSLRSENPAALYNLIRVHLKMGRLDEARNIYSALEYLKPHNEKVQKLKEVLFKQD